MNKRITLTICIVVLTLVAGNAWAESDAGPTDTAEDVTATTDSAGDAVAPPTDATSTGDSYTVNACWDDKCAAEITACKANAGCDALAGCLKKGGDMQTCTTDLKTAEADYNVFNAIQICGWKACNDPTKGLCSEAGKGGAADKCGQFDNNWPCNCDDACGDFGDCCQDFEATCGGGGTTTDPADSSCEGNCGGQAKSGCYCDDECADFGDCCEDIEAKCGGAAACVPQCDGKACGDNGCDGTCGVCAGGAVCNASGECVGGSEADAGATGGDSTGPTTDPADVGGSDTATTGGTDATTGGGTSGTAKSSGCSTGTSGSTAGFGFALLAVLVALGLRRRRTV